MLRITGPREPRKDFDEGSDLVNTTSRSGDRWSRGLSPFYLGPVKLYGGYEARNVENAWQFAKVYAHHLGPDGNPTDEYFAWAREGWADSWAHRYPAGKGAVPEYSWWDGEKLDYVTARKKIYVPLYTRAVINTKAFQRLREIHKKTKILWLWDFDGYDHIELGMSLKQVLNDPNRKMGHAFVLAMMLEELDKR